METKKIAEGLEYTRAAEKCLKTTLLKWRPDFESAADEYTKAATAFKLGKSYEQSKDCFLKASDCHRQNRNLFYAARSLEQAILVSKEVGDLRNVAQLAERACNMYQQQGSFDAAASALDKACKIIEHTQPAEAVRLYQKAADVVSNEDSPRQGAEYVSKVARLQVKLKEYDSAADSIRREIGLHQQSESLAAVGRLAVALVLVQLARGDPVAAEKAFKEWGNCCDPPEIQTLEMLLQAFDEEDEDGAKRALKSSFIKHMDVEYAILARDLPLPQPSFPAASKSSAPSNAPTSSSPITKTQDENVDTKPEDDEDEEDLR